MKDSLNPTLQRLLSLCGLDRTWVRGDGVWLFDADGRQFLDCYAQYGAVALGHNASCVRTAVAAALDACEPAMVQPYRAPHAVALAAKLTSLSPGNLSHVIFTTSGAEAVEAAIKLVRARTKRPLILSAHGSFHGKTLGALAATGQSQYAEGFGPMPPEFERVPFGAAEALAERLERDGPRVAGVLLEPIQGERGVHLPPPGYLKCVRELCTRHGAALILDEVQTGLGRTGRLFACEYDNVAPDVLLLAKALGGGLFPLGACLASADFWDERFALCHSSTFANNNVACRVGVAVLEALLGDGLIADVERKGEILLRGLARLAARYPAQIAAVRGRGLLCAIELQPCTVDHGFFLSFLGNHGLYAYAVAAMLAEHAGLLVLPTLGETPVLRIAPPLVITKAEIQVALDGLDLVFERLASNPSNTLARTLRMFEPQPPVNGHARTPVALPVPMVRRTVSPAFAFIMHPTRPENVLNTSPDLTPANDAEVRHLCDFIAELPPFMVMRVPALRSATGAAAEGWIITVPLLPQEMARRGVKRVSAAIADAVDLATHCGARVVGLGGHTTPLSLRGRSVLGRGAAITTGNALTAGMAVAAVSRLAEERDLDLASADVAVVGACGSVGRLCARLLARVHPRRLLLVGNPATGLGPLHRLRAHLECANGAPVAANGDGPHLPSRNGHASLARRGGTVGITTDLGCLAGCDIVITATGAAEPVLHGVLLKTGAVVCDLAHPPDTTPAMRARDDLVVIDGGLVALPDPMTRFGPDNLVGLPDGIQLACLCETILLALEGDDRDHGIGENPDVAEVDYMMALAERHGFRLATPWLRPRAVGASVSARRACHEPSAR
jgi:acetylornithine/succinyldiaminopimelate/putrescine aminotransferase/predicted amino acid dehydrogenase